MYTAGQILYKVPIRYWETQEPESCEYIQDGGKSGNGKDNLYVLHHGYGHSVYLSADDCFPTREEAVAEALRRKAQYEYEAEFEAECDAIFDKILASL